MQWVPDKETPDANVLYETVNGTSFREGRKKEKINLKITFGSRRQGVRTQKLHNLKSRHHVTDRHSARGPTHAIVPRSRPKYVGRINVQQEGYAHCSMIAHKIKQNRHTCEHTKKLRSFQVTHAFARNSDLSCPELMKTEKENKDERKKKERWQRTRKWM